MYIQDGGEEIRCKWNENVDLYLWGDTDIHDQNVYAPYMYKKQSECRIYQAKGQKDDCRSHELVWAYGRRHSMEHAGRQITRMKPPGKKKRGRHGGWMM